jgi:hypothetical protein
VVERVGGERFSRRFLRDGGRFAGAAAAARLENGVRLCGRWLSAFHDAHRRGEVAPFGDEFANSVEEKLAFFTAHGLDRAAADTVRSTLERLHAFGRLRRVTLADQHGDFGPQNVHVGDGHIYVFDLNYHTAAPVYEDVDYFLVTLETMNPYPRQWLFDRGRVELLRAPFLEGYFGPGDDALRDVLLSGYYLKSLLFRCAKQRRNTARRGRAAVAVFDALRLRGFYPRRLVRQCALVRACLERCEGRGSA